MAHGDLSIPQKSRHYLEVHRTRVQAADDRTLRSATLRAARGNKLPVLFHHELINGAKCRFERVARFSIKAAASRVSLRELARTSSTSARRNSLRRTAN